MLEQLQVHKDEALHKKIKNAYYTIHLDEIDQLIQDLKKEYPAVNTDNLVIKLNDIVEKYCEDCATLTVNLKKALKSIIKEEIDLHE